MKRINIVGIGAASLACLGGAQLASAETTTPIEELVLVEETRAPVAADASNDSASRQWHWHGGWHGHWHGGHWHGGWHGHWHGGHWHGGHWHGHWHGGHWHGHWRR